MEATIKKLKSLNPNIIWKAEELEALKNGTEYQAFGYLKDSRGTEYPAFSLRENDENSIFYSVYTITYDCFRVTPTHPSRVFAFFTEKTGQITYMDVDDEISQEFNDYRGSEELDLFFNKAFKYDTDDECLENITITQASSLDDYEPEALLTLDSI